ncbi:MAG: serine/threonine protein kinase, partial [Planctomycetota bacterium]
MEREHLGPFRILSLLGAGGMGRVYKARVEQETAKLEIGEVVALKVIHPHLFSRQGVFHRFLREAEAGRRIRHPNVIRTHYVDAILEALEHHNFLVMEYLEGRNLRQLLDELGTVPDALLREIARQVCSGLAAIHDAGIVHRDLKPENVLIAEDQQVKIMDLGLARLVEESVALTKAGQFFGTFTYAAPEIYEDGEAVLSSDVYSVGVMLYELATGGNPFHHEDAASVMRAHLKLVPPPAHEQNPEISPFLSAVIATMLEKRVGDRLGTATAVQAVLEEGERGAWWEKRQLEISRATDELPVIPIRRDASLRGREPELQVIREAWAEAREGGGSTVLLEGEAGIGKTRLIDGFLTELSGEDAHVLYGAYPPPSGVGALTEAIADKLGAADLEKTLARYLKVTPALVPAFAALVRHDSPPSGIEPLGGDAIHTVMCHLLRALSEEKPLVWVVDDLQFAEPDNRMIVLSMARAVRDHRALLVVAARPELPEGELAHFSRLDGFRRVEVARLASPHVAEILTDVLQSEVLSSRLGPTIAEKSDGIPFFVFEMIRELKEGSFITERPDGTYVESRSIEEIEVPSAVRDMIQARLKDLSRDERDVLEVGAVQGIVFDPSLVASVLGKRPLAVLQDLADLERRSGVVRGEAGRCRFDHHQIQLVLYQDLLPDLRAEYHSLLAEAVEERSAAGTLLGPETLGDREILLAHHHVHGSRPQMCLPHLGPALDHLEKAFRNEAARGLADLALNVPG